LKTESFIFASIKKPNKLFCNKVTLVPPYKFDLRLSSLAFSLRILQQRKMAPVPRHSTLKLGVPVDIVLKADQRTGKLTRGLIAEVLTRGDHPHGVKVRLESGAVGRVQSLAVNSAPPQASGEQSSTSLQDGSHRDVMSSKEFPVHQTPSVATQNYRFQEDFRKTEPPASAEAVSLTDYIKAPSRNKQKKGRKSASSKLLHDSFPASTGREPQYEREADSLGEEQISEQTRLQTEFPKLDSALIAAILSDCDSIQETRAILVSLS
jgi:uncharacterized repeat protein (TIGR03833 family)